MGAETQLSLLMAVNHDKLSIKYFLQKLKKVTLQFCKAGSGSALRKTAGSGSAKKRCGSTALLGAFYIAQSNIYLSFLQLSSKRTKYLIYYVYPTM